MAETLLLKFDDDAVSWVQLALDGSLVDSGQLADEEFRHYLGTRSTNVEPDVILLIPSEDVLLTSAVVPSRQYRQIVQAVPYVVEEQLAMDIEDCFFAIGGRTAAGSVEVVVVADEKLAGWINRARLLGVKPRAVYAELTLLPAENRVHVLIDGDRAHFRWGVGQGLLVDPKDLPLALSLISGSERDHVTIHGQASQLASIELQMSEINAAEAEQPVVDTLDVPPMVWLARNLRWADKTQSINLLQGKYKVENSSAGQNSVWRSVAMLSLIALVIHLSSLLGQGFYLKSQAEEFGRAAESLYAETFPSDRNVRDYRKRWNAHLGRGDSGSDNDFLRLFALSAEGLASAGLTLNNVNFNESRGDLVLQVTAPRSEDLVQYIQKLATTGLAAEIGTISQEDGAVRGSIKVRAATGAS